MSDFIDIESNKRDFLVSVAKSTVGIVPYAGPILAELIGVVIPNQRIDRLSKYIKYLDERLSHVPMEIINSLKDNEEFIDLIEESFVQASRAITDNRRKYIASIVSNGLSLESINLVESKHLLKILQELNDIEIIWLRSFLITSGDKDEAFKNNHKNILTKIDAFWGSEKEVLNKAAIQSSYILHLERLELIEMKIQFDRAKGLPEFDKISGKPKTRNTTVTQLGKLLLEHLEI